MKARYRYDWIAKMWFQQWTEEYITAELLKDKEPPPGAFVMVDSLASLQQLAGLQNNLSALNAQAQMMGAQNCAYSGGLFGGSNLFGGLFR